MWARVAAHASLQLLHSHPRLVRVWVRYLSPHHVASVICSTSHCNAPAASTHSASTAETQTHVKLLASRTMQHSLYPKVCRGKAGASVGVRYADDLCEPAQRVNMECLVELKAHLGDTSCPPAQTLPHILPAAAVAGRCPVDATTAAGSGMVEAIDGMDCLCWFMRKGCLPAAQASIGHVPVNSRGPLDTHQSLRSR